MLVLLAGDPRVSRYSWISWLNAEIFRPQIPARRQRRTGGGGVGGGLGTRWLDSQLELQDDSISNRTLSRNPTTLYSNCNLEEMSITVPSGNQCQANRQAVLSFEPRNIDRGSVQQGPISSLGISDHLLEGKLSGLTSLTDHIQLKAYHEFQNVKNQVSPLEMHHSFPSKSKNRTHPIATISSITFLPNWGLTNGTRSDEGVKSTRDTVNFDSQVCGSIKGGQNLVPRQVAFVFDKFHQV